ncbi:MAG: carboxypeptidase regulatory-like domain-containing protein [Planctomycetota bacterium]
MQPGPGSGWLCKLAILIAATTWAWLPAQTLSGITVLDENGTPVEGAIVSQVAPGGALMPLATTDAAGRCTAAPTTASGSWWQMHVAAKGLGSVTARFSHDWALPQPALVLARGHVLHGRVRDQAGQPIAGAEVSAIDIQRSPWASPWSTLERARSDERGIFTLRSVPEHSLRLLCDADGFRSVSLTPVQLGTPLELTLEPAGRLAGTVLDAEGKPTIADLEICYENRDDPQCARSGADGRFDITWRHATFCRVVARQGQPITAFAHSEVLQAPTADLQLRLRPLERLPMLRVRVTGDEDAPLQGFRAVVVWFGESNVPEQYLRQQLAHVGRDDRAGVACVLAPSTDEQNKGVVFVKAPGRAPAKVSVEWTPAADGATEVLVPTSRARRLLGKVVDAAGAPVARAKVWADPVAKHNWEMPPWAPFDAIPTNADGSFVIDGLAPGPYDVFASRAYAPERRAKRIDVPATGEPSAIELVVPLHVVVAGHAEAVHAGWQLGFVPPTKAGLQFGDQELPPQALGSLAADGSFSLAGVQTGTQTPTLLIPRPVQRGEWLRIPLSTTRIGDDGVSDLRLDASLCGPALLRGRIERRGAEPPFERLLVQHRQELVANPLQTNFVGDYRAWSNTAVVRGDGSFELPAVPGKHRLRVVDTMTGIVLAETAEALHADADSIVKVPLLVLDIAEVRLELVPVAADERGPALYLLHRKARAGHGFFESSIDDYILTGVDLRDRLTTQVIYVPAGEGKFIVTRQALPEHVSPLRVDTSETFVQPRYDGEGIPFEAQGGRPTTVRIEVPRRNM